MFIEKLASRAGGKKIPQKVKGRSSGLLYWREGGEKGFLSVLILLLRGRESFSGEHKRREGLSSQANALRGVDSNAGKESRLLISSNQRNYFRMLLSIQKGT